MATSSPDAECLFACAEAVRSAKGGQSKVAPADKYMMDTKASKTLLTMCGLSELVNRCDTSIFPKYKTKPSGKLNFKEAGGPFMQDLGVVYAELHKKKGDATEEAKVREKISKKGEQLMKEEKEGKTGKKGPGAGAAADSVTNRLTDSTKYTGAHKERFGDDGKGKGIEGREERVENKGYTGQYKGEGTHGTQKTGAKKSADDITKRLTDSSKYTGAHKERFGDDGKGKGKDGRVDAQKNTGYTGQYKGAGTFDKK